MPCCPFYGRYLFLIFSCHADGQMILGEPLLSAQSVSPGQHHLDTHPSLRTVYPTREPRRTSELSSKGKHLLAVHFLLRTVIHTHIAEPQDKRVPWHHFLALASVLREKSSHAMPVGVG